MQNKNEKSEKNFKLNEKLSFTADDIIRRLRLILKVDSDMQLAHLLNISHNTIYSWRNRGNMDLYGIIEKIIGMHPNKDMFLDMNYLIFGIGSEEIISTIENSSAIIQKLTHENMKLKEKIEEKEFLVKELIKVLGEKQ